MVDRHSGASAEPTGLAGAEAPEPPSRLGPSDGIPRAEDILTALKANSGDTNIWATELALSGGSRRCDFWELHCHQSKGYLATAYEIKVSRADFRRDHYLKQREARLYSDRFYYVAPVGVIAKDEVPDWAGLIEFDGAKLRTAVPAPIRDKDSPSWELVVALIRNSGEVRRDTDIRLKGFNFYKRECERLTREVRDLRHAIAAGTRSAETVQLAQSEGCQSGGVAASPNASVSDGEVQQ